MNIKVERRRRYIDSILSRQWMSTKDLMDGYRKKLEHEENIDEWTSSKTTYASDLKWIRKMVGEDNIQEKNEIVDSRTVPHYKYVNQKISAFETNNDIYLELHKAIDIIRDIVNNAGVMSEGNKDIVSNLIEEFNLSVSNNVPVQFETFMYNKGCKFISPILDAIRDNRPLYIDYEPFGKNSHLYIVSPYMLKKCNNRWNLICSTNHEYVDEELVNRYNKISVYPLDRIHQVENIEEEKIIFKECEVNLEEYFSDVIGVTVNEGEPEEIELQFTDRRQFLYVKTKPMHDSQRNNDKENSVTLKLIPNYELTRQLLSFGNRVKIIRPRRLAEEIANIHKEAYEQYAEDFLCSP